MTVLEIPGRYRFMGEKLVEFLKPQASLFLP